MQWREQLAAAERERAANADYWNQALPAIVGECLLPAAREFQAATSGYVQTHLVELPAENKIVLCFDDWHVGEWSLSVQISGSARDEASISIACNKAAPVRSALRRGEACTPETFLALITRAYVDRISRED